MTLLRWTTAVALCVALAAGPSFAADSRPSALLDSERITSGEIETFARASSLVQSIRNDLASRMRGASTPHQAATLVEAANSAMAWVVENEGLSLDRYNEISRAARSSPNLRNRILEVLANQR